MYIQLALLGAHQFASFVIWYSPALSSGLIWFARVLTRALRPSSKFRCGLAVLLSQLWPPLNIGPTGAWVFEKGVITRGLKLKAPFFSLRSQAAAPEHTLLSERGAQAPAESKDCSEETRLPPVGRQPGHLNIIAEAASLGLFILQRGDLYLLI